MKPVATTHAAPRAAALLALLLSLLAGAALAIDPMPFADAAEEERFRELTAELRCVMCQNQSLADSNAAIAQDLRQEVFDLMRQGMSDQQIKDHLTARYSDFVLYRPPVDKRTWILWFGPGVLLLGGLVALVVIVRRRSRGAARIEPLGDEDS